MKYISVAFHIQTSAAYVVILFTIVLFLSQSTEKNITFSYFNSATAFQEVIAQSVSLYLCTQKLCADIKLKEKE